MTGRGPGCPAWASLGASSDIATLWRTDSPNAAAFTTNSWDAGISGIRDYLEIGSRSGAVAVGMALAEQTPIGGTRQVVDGPDHHSSFQVLYDPLARHVGTIFSPPRPSGL